MGKNSNISKVFSKEYQNNLKERFENGLKETWGKDSDMVDWCMKQITYLIPICGGKYILELTKPNIKTDFYFGYSDHGQGPTWEENNKSMNMAHMMIEDYFIDENMSDINNCINKIKEVLDHKTPMVINHFVNYNSSPENSVIHGFNFYNPYDWHYNKIEGSVEMTKEDIKLLLEGYELHKERFEKRLNAYLKRFGNKNLYISSYWIDR